MEHFTLTLTSGSAVFDGTTVTITSTDGVAVVFSSTPAEAPTVVDVTQGEELKVEETDATPETPAAVEAAPVDEATA